MRPHSIIRTLAAAALLLAPAAALAAPDQNTQNNGCPNGQWRNQYGQCGVWNNGNNGQWNNNGNNGQWNNNGRHRHRDRDDNENRGNNRDRDDNRGNGNRNNGNWNNGQYNGGYNNGRYNGGYNNGQYNNGRYGNRGNQLSGTVSSFSAYNLYLGNGTHVLLHNGTVINPTGTNLTAGQRVRVIGNWNSDGTFNANEVDVVGSRGYNR